MPQIFDNIEQKLLTALQGTMGVSYRADFCVGYFNLRGWRELNQYVKDWSGGNENCCRLLVGMQRPPEEELHRLFDIAGEEERIDNKKAAQYKRQLAEEFRRQLTIGVPTNQDEAGLRQLVQQIQDKKLVVKLFLRHPLHAKLYLLFRNDVVSPRVGYLGIRPEEFLRREKMTDAQFTQRFQRSVRSIGPLKKVFMRMIGAT